MVTRSRRFGPDVPDQTVKVNAPSDDLSPSSRVLLAVEKIAALGPMTYEALRRELGISKTATWRLVATLKESGWVRLRHGGRVIELDHRLDDIFAAAHFADAEFAPLTDAMTMVAQAHGVHVDLFATDAKGAIELYETTRRMTAAAHPIDTEDETLCLAVLAAMTGPQLDRYLQQASHTMDPDALRGLARRYRSGDPARLYWGRDGRVLFVSVRGSMGTPAALRFGARGAAVRREDLIAAFDALREQVPALVGVSRESTVGA